MYGTGFFYLLLNCVLSSSLDFFLHCVVENRSCRPLWSLEEIKFLRLLATLEDGRFFFWYIFSCASWMIRWKAACHHNSSCSSSSDSVFLCSCRLQIWNLSLRNCQQKKRTNSTNNGQQSNRVTSKSKWTSVSAVKVFVLLLPLWAFICLLDGLLPVPRLLFCPLLVHNSKGILL